MKKSILTNDLEHCYVCKTPFNIHIHHVYGGTGRRKLSDKYGCIVPLCAYHHNMSNEGVHFNRALDLKIKRDIQKRFVEVYPNLDFIKVFGKSYL